jgi:hypothetical protein
MVGVDSFLVSDDFSGLRSYARSQMNRFARQRLPT